MIILCAGKTGRPKEEVVFERNHMAQMKAFLVQKRIGNAVKNRLWLSH